MEEMKKIAFFLDESILFPWLIVHSGKPVRPIFFLLIDKIGKRITNHYTSSCHVIRNLQ